MKKFKRTKKVLALLLSLSLITGMIPGTAWSAFAAEENALAVELKEELAEAKAYTDGITINNSSNDPATVVKNFGTHFTWDNEKREKSKSYLFDWSYYNGVVFEGMEYLYETTGEEEYKDYVVEYMKSLIATDGTWAKCSNNSSKECAGYNSTHGADCYKTASLLLDAYEMTNDNRYLTMAATLYADLDTAAKNYSLANAGKNYRHTWASNPDPDLWLDGLYMILPFRAEYAKYIGDTEELDLIVDRMQWVSDNMYNKDRGLFYHAADNATSNSGTYWLRSIGWYAAAIVDIMDSVEGENLEAMKAQLVKLVDGMKACQNSSNGMWLNNMAASQSSTNPYETSGTALTCYAIMKAVNEGWLDESYADMAILAFEGICNEKMSSDCKTLTDICFKGAPGSSNSTFYDNEGKGVGPFIMLYAEVLEYVNDQQNEEPPIVPEEPDTPVDPDTPVTPEQPETPVEPDTPVTPEEPEEAGTHEVTVGNATIEVENVTNLTGGAVTEEDKALIETKEYADFVAYDITAIVPEGEKATVNIPIPAEWDVTADRLVGISVEDGAVVEIPGEFSADGIYSFEVDHFSAKGVALIAETVSGTGNAVKIGATGKRITSTNNLSSNEFYLIQNTKHDGYLTNVAGHTNNGKLLMAKTNQNSPIVTEQNLWYITSGYGVQSGNSSGKYLTISDGGAGLVNNKANLTLTYVYYRGCWELQLNGQYLNRFGGNTDYAAGWRVGSSDDGSRWDIYKVEKSAVNFSVSSDSLTLTPGQEADLTATVAVGGTLIDLSKCTINWTSSNTGIASVSNGKVTANAPGSTSVVATLTGINGYTLESNIVVRVPVTVSSKYVVGRTLTGNTPVTITEGLTPDFSNLVLTLTYNDESTETITADRLAITGYDINEVGTQVCTVSYDGVECGTVDLIVNAKQVIDTKLLNSSITVVEGIAPDYSNVKYVISYNNYTSETFTVANTLTIDTENYKGAKGKYVLPVSLNGNNVGTVTVYVVENTLASAVVNGNTSQTIEKNGTPDYSGIELVLTYKDGTTETIRHQNLKFEGLNPNAVGEYNVTISYDGHEYGSVKVTVVDSTFDGKTEAKDYPKYPEGGAVRIKKTADQTWLEDKGVAKVELDVAGVSERKAVDVVLITDISNSMAWSLDNSDQSTEANRVPSEGQSTKLDDAMIAAAEFADVLLKSNTGNRVTDNTLSFVTFAGFDETFGKDSKDSNCVDSLMEVFNGVTSSDLAKNSFLNTKFTSKDTSYNVQVAGTDGNVIVSGSNRGDTNYDYAFWQAMQTVNSIKEKNEADDLTGRDIYVLFMTDGAPSHYNGVNKNGGSGRNDLIPDSSDSYKTGSKYTQDNWFEHFSTNSNTYAKELYDAVNGNLIAVGFDLANGGLGDWQWTEAQLSGALEQVAYQDANKQIEVFATADSSELSTFYAKIANKIALAGTNAVTTDIVNDSFTVQLFPTTGSADGNRQEVLDFDPTITVKAYDLYTKFDTNDTALIGTRTGSESILEEIRFTYTTTETEDGKIDSKLTGATSTAKEGNILTLNADGSMVIKGKYLTYYKTADSIETFEWNIGNITDKEVALSYYAYLDGSMEGKAPEGKYYTNENAILEYLDIKGNYAKQEFPMPAVVWGGAVTGYEFYLVNGDGKPCDRQGNEIPFANRIVITGPYYQDLYLNDEHLYYCNIEAKKVLPIGYTLYDDTASYKVQPVSGTRKGELSISDPEPGKQQTTIEVGNGGPDYTQTHVAFGVMYNEIPEVAGFTLTPDQVVIDYGKSIEIDTMSNNTEIPAGYTATLVGLTSYTEGTELSKTYNDIAKEETLEGTYGTFSVKNGKVLYTPTKLVDKVDKIFGVVKLVKGEDEYFMVDQLYVIPATIMYYETDFTDKVFTNITQKGAWEIKSNKDLLSDGLQDDGTTGKDQTSDGPQDDGTIGEDQTYGFDSTYNNDSHLSNGSSLFVEGQGIQNTVSEFSFEGRGFDLISRTGELQGAIRVDVYSNSAKTNKVKSVTVLNKSESKLELYQIPVVSINDLPYGKYYVTIGVNKAYSNESYPQLNRGGEFYFDAIRVYNPTSEKIATDAYKKDGEYNMSLVEVRDKLINAKDYDLSVETPGVTFVDNMNAVEGENGTLLPVPGATGSVDVGTYSSIGPNNEVYLAKNQAIAFKINWTGAAPKSIDLGVKSITGGTAHMKAFISKDIVRPEETVVDEDINSSTVQFQHLVNAGNAAEFSSVKGAYVFVSNEGESVLSITDIKVAYGDIANAVGEVSFFSNARTLAFARACVAPDTTPEESETPVVPDTPEVPEQSDTPTVPDKPENDKPAVDKPQPEKPTAAPAKIISVRTDKKTYIQGDQIKVTLITNSDATKVKVGGETLKSFESTNGIKSWTTTVKASNAGKLSIDGVAYNKDDKATKKITKMVNVRKFAPKKFRITLSKSNVKNGATYTVTVKTSTEVKYVKVNGKIITDFTTDKKKATRTFKITYKTTEVGKEDVNVVTYNEAGYASKTKSRTVTVKK